MGEIRDFRDLRVWQKAMRLASQSCRLAVRLPPTLRVSLGVQLCRSSVSVCSNITEGHEQSSARYRHHVRIALGSLAELYTQLLLCVELDALTRQEWTPLSGALVELQRMLRALHTSLKAHTNQESNSS
jgi:four helix bundle protein